MAYKVVGTYTSGNNIRDAVVVGSEIVAVFGGATASIRLRRIDPVAMADIAIASGASSTVARVAYDGTHVWATESGGVNQIFRIDPLTLAGTTFAGNTAGFNNFRDSRGIAFDGSLLWIANHRQTSSYPLLGYDGFTQAGVYSNNFSAYNFGVHWDGTNIWVSDTDAGVVRKINPTSGAILATVTVSTRPEEITSGAGSIWVGNETSNNVSRISQSTGAVTATIAAPSGTAVRSAHFALGLCWFGGSSSLFGIDPATNTVTVTVASVQAEIIIDDGTFLYCLEPGQNRMTKIGNVGGIFTDGASHL